MDTLLCPCGSSSFTQTRLCQVEFTVRVTSYGIEDESEETQDSGERDSELTCAECGDTFDADTDELLTEEQYKSEQEAEEIFGLRY